MTDDQKAAAIAANIKSAIDEGHAAAKCNRTAMVELRIETWRQFTAYVLSLIGDADVPPDLLATIYEIERQIQEQTS